MTRQPVRRINLVRGLAAIQVARFGVAALLVWAVALAGVLILVQIDGIPAWLLFGAVGVNLVALLVMLGGLPVLKARREKELAAGYTTLASGHPEVARVHFPTGFVMREVGEAELSAAETREFRDEVAGK